MIVFCLRQPESGKMAASMRKRCLCRFIERVSTRRKGLYFFSSMPDARSHVRVRFAPSPTGYLHLGGLRTALYNYLFAKSRGGTFILRIEDTDQSRVVPDAVKKLEQMLKWAGLEPDEGPSIGGSCAPYIQSERLELYQESIKHILKNGTAYRCFCTHKRLDLLRKEAASRGETPRYDNRCRDLPPDVVQAKLNAKEPYVVRLKLAQVIEPWDDLIKGVIQHQVGDIEGDPVILKSDGFPTYHLANVVDDHYMNISHVLRGDEWIQSTPKHIMLYRSFGWPLPRFAHLPLIINIDGTKLSKRQDDIHVEHLKEMGYTPDGILSYITTIGGGFDRDTTTMILPELVRYFDIARVKRYHSRLDPLQQGSINRAHLARMMKTRHMELVHTLRGLLKQEYGHRLGPDAQQHAVLSDDFLSRVLLWSITEDRINTVYDLLKPSFSFLWWEEPQKKSLARLKSQHQHLHRLLTNCSKHLKSVRAFEKTELQSLLNELAISSGLTKGAYMHLLRAVLSGLKEGPPVVEMMSVMGRDNTLMRIEKTLQLLQPANFQ